MGDAPKELHFDAWDLSVDVDPIYNKAADGDNTVKYIRADIAEAWEEAAKDLMEDCAAAYSRGLEEAAKIADEAEAEFEYSASLSANAAGEIARRIRAKIGERDDG